VFVKTDILRASLKQLISMVKTINLSRKIEQLFAKFAVIVRKLLDRLIGFYRRKRMKYPIRHCEICNRNLKKDQLDLSRKEYKKSLCNTCQDDEERDKALGWINNDRNGAWMFG
jgi:hypothetical protein